MKQSRAVSTRQWKRLRLVLLVGFILTTILLLYRGQQTPPPLEPLPGTYPYFTEKDFHSTTKKFGAVSHCDPRFAPQNPPEIEQVRRSLKALLESYMTTMEELGIETWVAHGTLLGWYWNKHILPWDTDIDVQLSAESLALLAKSYNMTEYLRATSGLESPRTYLLDINPHYTISSHLDISNKIDGRWIDTTNGKYIDLTAVHSENANEADKESGILFCKDGHQYRESDIYPLQESILEGTKVHVPFSSADVLQEEYGKKSLSNGRFHWHHFNRNTGLWEPD